VGHFIVHAGGETLLSDLGGGVYTREYFGAERYSFQHNGSAGHSVPVINGQQQAAGENHRAEARRMDTDGDTVLYELDLTSAYPPEAGLRSFSREFEWDCLPQDNRAMLTITDRFDFKETALGEGRNVTEHFISYYKPVVSRDKVVWRGEKGTVTLRFDPAVLEAEAETLETRKHDTSPVTVFRLRLHTTNLRQQFTCRLVMDCSIAD
jgi:hypothetical protein